MAERENKGIEQLEDRDQKCGADRGPIVRRDMTVHAQAGRQEKELPDKQKGKEKPRKVSDDRKESIGEEDGDSGDCAK